MERNVKDEQRTRERGSLMDWLQETMIYKQFVSQGPSDDYKSSVKKTCSIAINLSSDIVLSFTHFTRHDYVHIQNVIKIMENLLGAEGIAHLSCDEAAMLLLCACWHDIGMVISSEEYSRLSEISAAEWKDYFKKHKDKEHLYKTGENSLTDFIPDLVREIHPSRVKRALIESNVWQNWSIGNHIDIDDLCAICKNHGEPIQSMRSYIGSNRHYDMTLCAVLLRLADIMDFDTSRAPKELFYNRMIDRPTTEEDAVSKSEWEKHMASYGFDFTFDTMLPFYAESTEPNNYYEIVQFLDWIDLELCSCRNEIQLSEKWKNILRLPERIDRTIKAIGFDSYGYKLSIDRDSVIKLLHGENLYAENGAFIRELLQNAIDAVQIRRKMLEHSSFSTDDRHDSEQIYTDESGNVWEPEIIVRSWTEGAYTWISVDDNGIGMNKQIISDYFLNIGKSYYNSEEFRTLVSDETYVANSRFGIGILSCYMMDEDCCRIEVSTKHFSDKRGEATIRISISDTRRYYFLSSKDNDFIPRWNSILTSPQIQKSGRVDSNGYRNQIGTTIAVRFPLKGIQNNEYFTVKNLLDHFVRFPDVKIRYISDLGDDYTYPTKTELNKTIELLGEFSVDGFSKKVNISMSDELFSDLKELFPEAQWQEKPKAELSFFAIGKNVIIKEHPDINGIYMFCETDNLDVSTENIAEYGIIDFQYNVEIRNGMVIHRITPVVKNNVLLELRDKVIESVDEDGFPDDQLYREICGAVLHGHAYYPTWQRNIARKYGISEEELRQKAWNFDVPGLEKTLQNRTLIRYMTGFMAAKKIDIPGSRILALFTDYKEGRAFTSEIIAYDGINCSSEYTYHYSASQEPAAGILLLYGKHRPLVPLSRNYVKDVPFETRCIIQMINSVLKSQSRLSEIMPVFPNISNCSFGDICKAFDSLPDIENAYRILVAGQFLTWKEIEQLLQSKKKTTFRMTLWEVGYEYVLFCIAILKRHFTISVDMSLARNPILCVSHGKEENDERENPYPPGLFLQSTKGTAVFSTGTYSCIPVYNAEHRFSNWMLEKWKELKDKAPHQLESIVNTLTSPYDSREEYFDRQRIKFINSYILQIKNMGTIYVPDDIILKDEDFMALGSGFEDY